LNLCPITIHKSLEALDLAIEAYDRRNEAYLNYKKPNFIWEEVGLMTPQWR